MTLFKETRTSALRHVVLSERPSQHELERVRSDGQAWCENGLRYVEGFAGDVQGWSRTRATWLGLILKWG